MNIILLQHIISITLPLIFLELNWILGQMEQDFDKLNQLRKLVQGVKWKTQVSELTSRFKDLLKPSLRVPEALSIEPYHGSILDYPKPDESKKLKIFEISWNEYYECLKSQYASIGTDKVFPPQAVMVFAGSNMRLKCDLCISPDNIAEAVQWYYSTNMNEEQVLELDEDSNIVISHYDNTLHILSIEKSNSGLYQCHFKNTQSTVYFVHVVDKEPINLVRPPTALRNHSLLPVQNTVYGITVWNDWSGWSKCSHCGKVGKRIRTGYCTVTLTENLNVVADNITSTMSDQKVSSTAEPKGEISDFTETKISAMSSDNDREPKKFTNKRPEFELINFQQKLRNTFGVGKRRQNSFVEVETTSRGSIVETINKSYIRQKQLETKSENFERLLEKVFFLESNNFKTLVAQKKLQKLLTNIKSKKYVKQEGPSSQLKNSSNELEKIFDQELRGQNSYYKQLICSNVRNNQNVKQKKRKKKAHSSDSFWLWTKSRQNHEMKHEDLTILRLFDGGIPCRSQLLPNSIRSLPEVSSRSTDIMVAYCKESCIESVIFQVYNRHGKVIEEVNNTAGLYSTLQDLPKMAPTVVRHSISVKANYRNLKIICPANIQEDVLVEWQVKSKLLNPTQIQKQTNGRVMIDLLDRIVFASLKTSDENTYSCWQSKELVGVVMLVVDQNLPYEINRQFLLLGVLPVAITFTICLYRVFKLRHRGFS